MACFLVPAAEAVAVGVAHKIAGSKENHKSSENSKDNKLTMGWKLSLLTKLLSGGSVLLAFEHIWHGEVVPFFPFLSAMADPAETAEMLHEMGTVGVTMAVIVTAVWAGICVAADSLAKRGAKQEA